MANKAYEIPNFCITGVNGESFEGKRYAPVKMATTGKVVPCAATEAAIGFIQHDYPADQASKVMVSGITFAVASAAIEEGVQVEADADGKVKTLGTGKPLGTCVAKASGAGAICSILIGK